MKRSHRDLLFGGVIFAAGLTAQPAYAQALLNGWQDAWLEVRAEDGTHDSFDIYYLQSPLNAYVTLPSGSYTRWDADTAGLDIRARSVGDEDAEANGFTFFDAGGDMDLGIRWDFAGLEGVYGFLEFRGAGAYAPPLLTVNPTLGDPATGTAFVPLEGGEEYYFRVLIRMVDTEGASAVIARPAARCDFDVNAQLNIDDVELFVTAFLAGDLLADMDGTGELNIDDIDAFVACFLED